MEPNYQSIIITNLSGLLLLAGMFASSYMMRERRHLEDRLFTLLIAVCAGACIFEPITWLVDGNTAPWAFFLNYLGNTYCYLTASIYAYLWVLYVDVRLHKGTVRIRSYFPVVLVPTVIACVADLGNLIGGYLFTISDGNVYSRQPLAYLNVVVVFWSLLYSVHLRNAYKREHGTVRFFPMFIFIGPIFVGSIAQTLFFGISVAWASICFGIAGIYMSLQNELSYVDPLTNLFNRTYLDLTLNSFEHMEKRFSGIMIDLDRFKEINDTYGHSAGDDALVAASQAFVSCLGDKAIVVRYAGDEFVVLFEGGDDKLAAQAQLDIERAIDELNAASELPYAISVSMGHGEYVPGSGSPDDFMKLIDRNMYAQKREHHASRR